MIYTLVISLLSTMTPVWDEDIPGFTSEGVNLPVVVAWARDRGGGERREAQCEWIRKKEECEIKMIVE